MKRLLLALLCISQLNGMELVERKSVSSKDVLNLYTNKKDFYVEDENAAYRVDARNFNPLLTEVVKRQALDKFAAAGYIRINKLEDGKYALAAKVRGNGGGWLTGKIAAYSVRGVGYGSYAVLCILHPTSVAEAHLVYEAVEATAVAAEIIGTILPLP